MYYTITQSHYNSHYSYAYNACITSTNDITI